MPRDFANLAHWFDVFSEQIEHRPASPCLLAPACALSSH
jgi:hypothetical protein